jgi:glycosyltransferase involved in cell wall biosynthesis
MRILHLDTGRELRGGQRQLLLLLRGLHKLGCEQVLLARRPLLDHWKGQPITVRGILQALRRTDLIHAHDARSHTLAALLSPGIPVVVSRRVAFPIKRGIPSRWKYSRADAYIAVSAFVEAQLLQAGVPAAKVAVIPDGVTLDPAARLTRQGVRQEGQPVRVVAPRVNDPLKCAGLLEKAGPAAGAQVVFSEDLETDLSTADVFVYLSESEGLGSAILLAMARGVPVVASNVGGIPELVEHEATGLLVENTVEDVVSAIHRMAGDEELARRCAENAYRKVSERYADDIMVRRTEQVYRDVLGLAPAP